MRKIPLCIFILFILAGLCAARFSVRASDANPHEPCQYPNATDPLPTNEPCDGSATTPGYHLLEPLPCDSTMEGCVDGRLESFDPTSDANGENGKFGVYLNFIIRLFIGLCAVLAVVMIVVGGIEYATSELIGNKAEGIERIKGALLGLLLALGAYTLLFQINPDLLKTEVGIGGVELNVTIREFDIRKEANYAQNLAAELARKANFGGIATTKGNCSIATMQAAGFSNPTQASCVCQGESSGLNQPSRSDICADGSSASIGLFQINIVAHASEIPICNGVFTGKFEKGNKSCRANGPNGGKEKYLACANYVNNPTFNIAFAQKLLAKTRGGNSWYPTWGAASKCHY